MAAAKDHALAAMKRAARAVLKDELKALKQAVKDAHQEQKEAVEAALRERDKHMREAADWKHRLGEAHEVYAHTRQQIAKAKAWQKKFAQGDRPFELALDYIGRSKPTGSWINSDCCCPFSRWGYTSPDELK